MRTAPCPTLPPSGPRTSTSTAQGGAIYAADGSVQLANGTLFRNNAAPTGATIHVDLAVVVYMLPAPAGHYVSAAPCRVVWASCPSSCSRDGRCTNNITLKPQASSDESCDLPPFQYQSCPWSTDLNPNALGQGLLGETVETLLAGELNAPMWPNPCSPGLLGAGVDHIEGQTSSQCAGPCPAGYYCPSGATTVPIVCDLGHYCPAGVFAPLPCPGGTYAPPRTRATRTREPHTTQAHRAHIF